MGNRSNLIIITNRREIPLALPLASENSYDLISGLACYSHWRGISAQIDALHAAREYGLRRLNDPAYFTRIVARAFTTGCDDELGAGFTPVTAIAEHNQPSMSTSEQMAGLIPDNDGYLIPVIDLVTKEIHSYEYDTFVTNGPLLVDTLPLSAEGIDEAIAVIQQSVM